MLLNCGVGEDSWESLELQGVKESILKEISLEYSLEGLMLKLKLQYFDHLMWRTDSLEKTPMLGKIESGKRRGWQRMRLLDGITDSMDMSLSNSGSWWWIGKPVMLQFMGSQRVTQNWATEPNWIELNSSMCGTAGAEGTSDSWIALRILRTIIIHLWNKYVWLNSCAFEANYVAGIWCLHVLLKLNSTHSNSLECRPKKDF